MTHFAQIQHTNVKKKQKHLIKQKQKTLHFIVINTASLTSSNFSCINSWKADVDKVLLLIHYADLQVLAVPCGAGKK